MDWEWVLRREAPCVAYEVETEVRFWKAERPTPRRVDIFCEEVGEGGGGADFSLCLESAQDQLCPWICVRFGQERYIACIRDLCIVLSLYPGVLCSTSIDPLSASSLGYFS